MTTEPRKSLCIAVCVFVLVATVGSAETIRVVSMNAWSGLTYRGVFSVGQYEEDAAREFRFEMVARQLAELDPDVIALNEINPLPSLARSIAESLQYAFVYRIRRGGVRIGPVGLPVNLREGDVILAREAYNLADAGSRNLTGGPAGNVASFQFGPASQVLATSLSLAGRTVHVFVTHWRGSEFDDAESLKELAELYAAGTLNGDEYAAAVADAVVGSRTRLEQAREALVFINQVAGHEPAILLGTLNALSDSAEIRVLEEAGFRDVWKEAGHGHGYTWDPVTNSNILEYGSDIRPEHSRRRRIDYIFVRGDGIRVRSTSVVLDKPTFGMHPSDHYGVAADLEFAAPTE